VIKRPEALNLARNPRIIQRVDVYSLRLLRLFLSPKIQWVILIVIFVAHAIPYLFQPFGLDQALYTVMARQFLAGQSIYLDFGDMNFPGGPLLQTLGMIIMGDSSVGFRLFDLLIVMATLSVIYIFTYRLFNSRILSLTACVLYTLSYFQMGFWHTAQRDGFAIPFLILALFPLIDSDSRHRTEISLLSGMSLAVAFWIKPIYFIELVALAIILTFRMIRQPGDRRMFLVQGLMIGSGFLAISVVMLGYLAKTGSLAAWYESSVLYNLHYSGFVPATFLMGLKAIFIPAHFHNFFITVVAFVGIWHSFHEDKEYAPYHPLLLFTIVTMFAFLLQGKGDIVYHRLPFLSAKAIWAAVGVRAILHLNIPQPAPAIRLRIGLVFLLVVVFAGSYSVVFKMPDFFRMATGRISLDDYQANIYPQLQEKRAVGRMIRDMSAPSDRVLVWGFDSIVQYYANRFPFSRFTTLAMLFILPEDSPLRKEWERLIVADFERCRPRCIVLLVREEPQWRWKFPNWPEYSKQYFFSLPELAQHLEDEYFMAYRSGDMELYVRNDPLSMTQFD